ncbi:MAG: prolipoprotein diacylglyceryl transferase family protein [Planctomycetota bacterium]
MHPMLGPLRAYPVAYLGGLVLHFIVAYVCARRLGVRRGWWLIVSLSYAVSMTAGARVLYDATHGCAFTLRDLLTAGYYAQGGLWGGPLVHLALITALVLALARPRAPVFDLVALALPLPMLIAKLGCFLNGCCYGAETTLPISLTFPTNPGGAPADVPLHPVQLYETGVLALAFVVLAVLGPRWSGLRLPWFLLIYGAGRCLLDFVRGDATDRVACGPFTASQLLCCSVAAAAAVLLWRKRRRNPKELQA